jgi:hypothetical protein
MILPSVAERGNEKETVPALHCGDSKTGIISFHRFISRSVISLQEGTLLVQ